MKVILHYIKPFIPRMSVGISIKFIGAVMELLLPWILSYLIDDIVPLRDIGLILLWGGAMVLAAVAALVTNIVANRMAAWVAQHTTQALRHDLFEKISYLSCSRIDSYTIPSLESRLTSDTYNVHQMIGMIQRMGVRAPILLVGGILITLTLDPVLTLVLVCTLPFLGVLVFSVSKRGIPLYVDLQKGVDTMVRTVRETISGIRVIKADHALRRELCPQPEPCRHGQRKPQAIPQRAARPLRLACTHVLRRNGRQCACHRCGRKHGKHIVFAADAHHRGRIYPTAVHHGGQIQK